MVNIKTRLTVAGFTFLLSLCLVNTWLWVQPVPPREQAKTPISSPQVEPDHFNFRLIDRGEDQIGPFRTYEASDGALLFWRSKVFRTPQKAKQELQKRLKGPTQIMEQGPVTDEKGQVIGERLLVKVKTSTKGGNVPCIYKTDGCIFYSTVSFSIGHVLAFEKAEKNK